MSSKPQPQSTDPVFLLTRLILDQNSSPDLQLDIPSQLSDLEDEEQSTDTMLIRLKETHMEQQNQLVKDLKYMSEESRKIIQEISVIQVELEKYHVQIDGWIKVIGDMEGFVSKVKGVREPFQKRSKNLAKLKDYLSGEKTRRR